MSEPFAVRGRIVTPSSIIVDGAVIIDGDSIVWMGEAPQAQAAGYGAEVVAAPSPTDGRYILPGLVDTHCHGGGGSSFPTATTVEAMMTAVWEHRVHGTTTLVGSLSTASPEDLRRQGQMMADLCDAGELDGIHFEGPFLASGRLGVTGMLPGDSPADSLPTEGLSAKEREERARAVLGSQDFAQVQPPNPALTRELMITTRGHTVSMTLAPEGKRAIGSGSVAEVLIENGAVPAFGHTVASAEFMRGAATWTREKLGLTPSEKLRCPRYVVTHFFNGMQPFHHRHPGPMLELLADAAGGGCILELIADGEHVDLSAVRNVFELVGRDSVVFVSNATAATGMPSGEPNSDPEDPNLHLVDIVRCAWKGAGIPLTDAVYCASVQGARILGQTNIGEIATGKRADLLVTDENLYPLSVYRYGTLVASVPKNYSD